ncbi:MAG: recombination mediator protein UvsY [Desulfobulbia bacterium]
MEIDDIIEMWNKDAPISEIDLGRTSREIPKLHAKYYGLMIEAKREIIRTRGAFKRLRAMKADFLANPTHEVSEEMNWEYPDRTILKGEIKDYLEGDKQLVKVTMQIEELDLKIELIQEILKQVHGRNWLINNALKDRAFLHGE